MMIIHSPQPWKDFHKGGYSERNVEALGALEEAYHNGQIRSIGVSNFKDDLANILENGTVKPAVNQILAHISNTPFELIDYCKKRDMLVEAYSPFGHGELLKNTKLKEIADKYNVTVPHQLFVTV